MTAAITFRSESCDYYTVILEGPDYEKDLRSKMHQFSQFEMVDLLEPVSFAGEIDRKMINFVQQEYQD